MDPPTPALALPSAKASAAVAVAPMPTRAAADGFCDVARMARPAQVRVRTTYSPPSTTIAARNPYVCAFGSRMPPMEKDSSKYDGVADRNRLPTVTLRTPSMTSASPKVSSTDMDGDCPLIRETTNRYVTQPSPNINGVVMTEARIGSMPMVRHNH